MATWEETRETNVSATSNQICFSSENINPQRKQSITQMFDAVRVSTIIYPQKKPNVGNLPKVKHVSHASSNQVKPMPYL